ncbi:hypothetical protein [Parasphingorhabdus halotolerans]|uniref:Uncharacterized protein n=1 Tax=Parasphingorhabdus halotolerans TaxID=2725558 RepID=A0A6H2DM52_9SPHN|nr:hypothetical protein [Parasphingorhabdus halotolerans]QJB69268.1 hypothetical protein HF685_08240 [Parasphingorhabdus halotolerans]
MISSQYLPFFYYGFLIIVCGYAIKRGHREEYIGAAIMFAGSVATGIVARVFGTAWSHREYGILGVDLLALLALIYVMIRSDRFWPIWATAFHLLAVTIHVAMMVAPEITPWAFATGAGFWAYPMLLALAIGTNEYVRPDEINHIPSG